MTIEDTVTRESFLLQNIPHGPHKTKTFTYKKYGGREKAHKAAKAHMKELQQEHMQMLQQAEGEDAQWQPEGMPGDRTDKCITKNMCPRPARFSNPPPARVPAADSSALAAGK